VKDWDPTKYMEPKAAKRAARFSQFAVAAARQAVDNSGLAITDANRDDIAVVMNTGGGGVDSCRRPTFSSRRGRSGRPCRA
jgi:3-oxoacyl-[acyl-carrier-protein] synthase II